MKQIMRQGLSLFGRIVIVTIMSFFICVSINVLCTAGFTEKIGYDVYGCKADSEDAVHLYTHYHKDGEDTEQKTYEDEGYTLKKTEIRSSLSKTGNAVFLTVTQIFSLLLLMAFVYPNLWHLGAKDSNLVRFKHQEEDNLKGLKIGAVSQIPAFLLWVATLIFAFGVKPALPTALYRFINCNFYSFIQVVFGSAQTLGELKTVQLILLLLPLAVVMFIAWLGYFLGYKDFSISEKLIYKKKN